MINIAIRDTDDKRDQSETPQVDEGMHPTYSRALATKLLRAREAVVGRFRPALLARNLTDQQWRIIRALTEFGEAEILVLSDACCIHPASLSRILPKMESGGLITRRTNAADKRRIIVSLAENGRALYDSLAPEADTIFQDIIRLVGAERLNEVNRLLDELVDILTVPGSGRHS
jgi:homoprotocatechuate degradation regulator HpaR